MLTHTFDQARPPERVVILGGSGFVGRALAEKLQTIDIPTKTISSAELDLCNDHARQQLEQLLRPTDSLVVLAAITPDKGRAVSHFMRNLIMGEQLCAAFETVPCAHIVYFSSDAVYPLGDDPIDEQSPAAPADLYGSMHRSRELMLLATVRAPFCILRPTLIFGAADSHNSYGPNRFRRQARAEGKIVLGGAGEETRDHVYIDDVVEIAWAVLSHQSRGTLNIATGRSTDFATLARLVADQFDQPIEIVHTPRSVPVTHRRFDVAACRQAFPGVVFTELEQGIQMAHRKAH